MPYVKLSINSGNQRVDELIGWTIEPYLVEAHWLLAATRPAEGPEGHFARACAVMLLATVAATSALPTYQRNGRKRTTDRNDFLECVRKYFPWEHITVGDDQYRSRSKKIDEACMVLYDVFRCPLFHSAGLVGQLDMAPAVLKTHPGHTDISIAEKRVEQIANYSTLEGQHVIELEFRRCKLHVDYFYWCVRKMVERYAADPENTKRILAHSSGP